MKKSLCVFLAVAMFVLSVPFLSACSAFRDLEKAKKGLISYSMALSLEEDMTLSGRETINYKNTTKREQNKICFNLYPRAFRQSAKIKPYTSLNEGKCFPSGISYGDIEIKEVKVEEKTANFCYVGEDEGALEVSLERVIEQGEKAKIEIEFLLTLPECVHRLGYYGGSVNLGNFYPILAVFEKGEYNITPYYSTGDPFYSELANYEVEFSYPSKYFLCSSGEVTKSSSQDGRASAEISASASRDFCITLTSEQSEVHKKVEGTLVRYVGYSEDQNTLEALEVCEKALKYFNQKFGKYPYKEIEVVKAPFVHGGMEYPGIVIISDSITSEKDFYRVIVHELAHEWWYAVVGNNQISEAWLDESLAEYSSVMFIADHPEFGLSYEELISEAFASYVIYADIVSTLSGKINTSMLLSVNEYNGDYEYSYMIYVRGVLMFDNLRENIGKKKLEEGLKKYYKKYKFSTASTDCFIECFIKTAGKDVGPLLDSWLQGKAIVGKI